MCCLRDIPGLLMISTTYVISLDYVLVWRMFGVQDAELGRICCSKRRSKNRHYLRRYSPVFPQRGPPTARSGYVHLEGLHTGLSRDAVPAGTKGKLMLEGEGVPQGFKMQAPCVTLTPHIIYRTNSWYICFSTFILDCLPSIHHTGSFKKVAGDGHNVTKGHRGTRLKLIAATWCIFLWNPMNILSSNRSDLYCLCYISFLSTILHRSGMHSHEQPSLTPIPNAKCQLSSLRSDRWDRIKASEVKKNKNKGALVTK